jgi:hypothetical protein
MTVDISFNTVETKKDLSQSSNWQPFSLAQLTPKHVCSIVSNFFRLRRNQSKYIDPRRKGGYSCSSYHSRLLSLVNILAFLIKIHLISS